MVLQPLMHVFPSYKCSGPALTSEATEIHVLIAALDLSIWMSFSYKPHQASM